MDDDDFALKQRPFIQQDLIAGMTVAKVVWAYEARDMNRLVADRDRGHGRLRRGQGQVHRRRGGGADRLLRDGPSMIVRDVRDFFWPEVGEVGRRRRLGDRPYLGDLRRAEGEAGGGPLPATCDELKEAQNAQASDDLHRARADAAGRSERTEGLIEVLEYWTDERVITVGARKVVLADKPNPFRIKRKPFVVCSAMPDAFQMAGISIVETLAQLQEYLWTLQNQRIDALRLLTNVITLIRSDVDDPDSFEFFPGAQWIVEDPGQVGQLQIDPTAAQITLEAESLIKGDLQNIMGGLPFAGGAESGSSRAQDDRDRHEHHHLDRAAA